MNEPDWTTHITTGAAWRRFGLMLLLVPVLACVGAFIAFTSLFQFFNVLAQGEPSAQLRRSGRDLGNYATAIIDFLTYNTDRRPFPFASAAEAQSGAKPGAKDRRAAVPTAGKKKTASRKKSGTAARKSTTSRRSGTRKTTTATRKTQAASPEPPPADADKPSG